MIVRRIDRRRSLGGSGAAFRLVAIADFYREEPLGTEISLDIGGLSISWSKNMRGPDHGFLFQPSDLQRFRSSQVVVSPLDDDDPELGEADRGLRVLFARYCHVSSSWGSRWLRLRSSTKEPW